VAEEAGAQVEVGQPVVEAGARAALEAAAPEEEEEEEEELVDLLLLVEVHHLRLGQRQRFSRPLPSTH